jgi:hypothetical protein
MIRPATGHLSHAACTCDVLLSGRLVHGLINACGPFPLCSCVGACRFLNPGESPCRKQKVYSMRNTMLMNLTALCFFMWRKGRDIQQRLRSTLKGRLRISISGFFIRGSPQAHLRRPLCSLWQEPHALRDLGFLASPHSHTSKARHQKRECVQAVAERRRRGR